MTPCQNTQHIPVFQALIWKRTRNCKNWEGCILSWPPQSSSGKKVGPSFLYFRTSVQGLHRALCLILLCSILKNKILSVTMQYEALLLPESQVLPLPVISLLSFKFPFIKIKPHFLLIFPVFFSKTEQILKADFFCTVFSCHFVIKTFFPPPPPKKKQLRDLSQPSLPLVWKTRGRMRSGYVCMGGREGILSVCLPACLPAWNVLLIVQ